MPASLKYYHPECDEVAEQSPPRPESRIEPYCTREETSLREVLRLIDANGKGIALVVNAAGRLLATLTDGDIRRAILAGIELEEPLTVLLDRKRRYLSPHREPVTGRAEMTAEEMLQLLNRHQLHQLPLLDAQGRVVDLVTLDDLLPNYAQPMEAVIMAGGFGTRLQPLTNDTPKPMLPVGGRPLLEVAVDRLQRAGIRRVNVTTHYLPEKIIEHFGDGTGFGVDLNYVQEENPLGTAGALRLLPPWEATLLVMNGDILTDMNFRSLFSFHREHQAVFTVAVRRYELRVPYGVVEGEHGIVSGIVEKPTFSLFVNAGIYLLEPAVRELIPENQRMDMPTLVHQLIDQGLPVASFPILEYWLDIGQPADYEQAQHDMLSGRVAA